MACEHHKTKGEASSGTGNRTETHVWLFVGANILQFLDGWGSLNRMQQNEENTQISGLEE